METKNFNLDKKAREIATAGIIGLSSIVVTSSNAYAFSESDILNVSPRDWVESVEKKLRDYNMKGIQTIASTSIRCRLHLFEDAKKKFPSAEVLVNFTYNHDYYKVCYGTVLIPKRK